MKVSSVLAVAATLVVGASAFISPTKNNNLNNKTINVQKSTNLSTSAAKSSSTMIHMTKIADPVAFTKEQIANNDVMVFSKSYCPYCSATKTLFEKMDGVDATVIELDLDKENGEAIQQALLDMTGQRTVPNVFVKGKHIGGNDDTQLAAKMGKIKKLLAE